MSMLEIEVQDCVERREVQVDRISRCEDLLSRHGLVVNRQDVLRWVQVHEESLERTGRIELTDGPIATLVETFAVSAHVSRDGFAESIQTLIELFHEVRNECLDLVGDDELIAFMFDAFEGPCAGSLELLAGRELERMARCVRSGRWSIR